ncbi:MAG: methylmalonyl-CoA mutase family protein [Actinomycetota bacterium]|nr:methylmalonyl-CoA mutase family protein [Actinomycetota bacterium]
MSEDEIVFWDRAENPEFEAWLKAAEAVVGEGNIQEVLHSDLAGGLHINPIYTDEMTDGLLDEVSEGIGLRSSNPIGNIKGWDIRQRHWITDASSANSLILEDLSRGARSIELAIEETQTIPFQKVLDGIMLDMAGIGLSCSRESLSAASQLVDYLSNKLPESSGNIFDLGVDPLGELLSNSLEISDFESHLAGGAELAGEVSNNFTKATTFRINGLEYAQLGADTVTEIAGVLSTVVVYLRAMERAGIGMEVALKQCLIIVSVGTDQFLDIAKLRALRLLLLNIGKACGVESFQIKIQAQTPDYLISRDDPWVNLLRTTIGCFSAATGGADIISIPAFDSAFGIPNEFGLRLARNTHLVLMEESNIHRVVDPAGGSWYVESLSADIAEKSWERFQDYESSGGFKHQVISGSYAEQAHLSREDYTSQVLSKEKILIGVNSFREELATELRRDPYPRSVDDGNSDYLDFRISDIFRNAEET